jgi:hypothetical protein
VTRHDVMSVFLSVSPFLPPPWGAVTTGALSVFNVLLEGLDRATGSHVSPYEELRKSIEKFAISNDLRHDHGVLIDVGKGFHSETRLQTTSLDKLTAWDGALEALKTYIDREGLSKLRTAAADIWTILETRTTHDFDTALHLLLSAIDLRLLLESASIKLEALEASVAQKNGQLDRFNEFAGKWMAHVDAVSATVGSHIDPGSWNDEAIESALADVGWIPNIEAWMERAKRRRLALISDTYRYTQTSQGEYMGPSWTREGWTWKDNDLGADGDAHRNVVWDTRESCCHDEEHKDTAELDLALYRHAVAKKVDSGFADYRQAIGGWVTYIAAFKELIPAVTPQTAPHVEPMKDGPPIGGGRFWVGGARMRYAFMAVDKKGPSQRGPWSNELNVGATKFATVSGFPPMNNIDAIRVMRQVALPGGDWANERMVKIVPAPGVARFDDVSDDD